MIDGLGNLTTYSYDKINRLITQTDSENFTTTYTYDAVGNLLSLIDVDGTSSFTYDDCNQLLNATHSDIDNDDETYSYDDNGNRTITGYDTGVNNELLSDGVYNYDYDDEGNLISQTTIATGEVRLFEWDYLNRLVAVTDFDSSNNVSQTVEFSYDMFGQRLSKVVDGIATYFVYDREDVILDFVDDGSGVELDMRYLHGAGIDQVLAQEDSNGNITWLLTDHLGTIRDLVDNTGDVVNHLTYDSYGNVVSETDASVDSRYRFTGREWDEEIDLYYYRARYYNGKTGRFISVDPISFDSGTYNLYGYVDNNPVNAIDPFGLASAELTTLLNTFEPSPNTIGKIPSGYQSKTVYKNYAQAYSRALIAFKSITTRENIATNRLTTDRNNPNFPVSAWSLTYKLKVNGSFASLRQGEREGGQASLISVGKSGPLPTIDLQPTKLNRRIEYRHHTRGYKNVTELKFRWKDSDEFNNFCIAIPAVPMISPQQQPLPPLPPLPQPNPTFDIPTIPPIPISPIPRWLNPFRNPIF